MHTARHDDMPLTAMNVPCSGPRRPIIHCPIGTGRGIPHDLDWDRYDPDMRLAGGPLDATEFVPDGSHWTDESCGIPIVYAGDLLDGY